MTALALLSTTNLYKIKIINQFNRLARHEGTDLNMECDLLDVSFIAVDSTVRFADPRNGVLFLQVRFSKKKGVTFFEGPSDDVVIGDCVLRRLAIHTFARIFTD